MLLILIVISTRKCAPRESHKYQASQVMFYFWFAQVGRNSVFVRLSVTHLDCRLKAKVRFAWVSERLGSHSNPMEKLRQMSLTIGEADSAVVS